MALRSPETSPLFSLLPERGLAVAMVVLAASLFAFMNALAKFSGLLIDDITAGIHLAFARYAVACALLSFVLITEPRTNVISSIPKLALRTSVGVLGVVCMFSALQSAPLATSVIFVSIYPILAMVLSVLLLQEMANYRHLLCACLGILGVFSLKGKGAGFLDFEQFWVISAAIFMALEIVAIKWISVIRLSVPKIVFLVNLLGALFLLPFVSHAGFIQLFESPFTALGLGFCAAIGQLLVLRASRMLDGVSMAPAFLTSLAFGALFGWWFFDEKLTRMEIFGASLICASACLLPWADRKNKA